VFNRIGILGDIHAEHERLEQALGCLRREGVDAVICTGDVADGEGCLDTCIDLLREADALTVRGNHDRWLLEDKLRHIDKAHQRDRIRTSTLDHLAALPAQITLATPRGNLLLCHGVGDDDLQKVWPGTERMPVERSARLDEIIAQAQTSIMVNGHVHYRTMIHFESMVLINAGTLRGDHRPGFSILDCSLEQIVSYDFEPEVRPVKTTRLAPESHHHVFQSTAQFQGGWEPLTLYA